MASALSNRQTCACARKTLQTQRGRTHGAGCVRQLFRTAEPLGERRYENWNTHTHTRTHTHTLLRTILTRGKSVMTSLIPSAEKGALSRGVFFLIRERLKGVETTHILVWLLVFCVIEENEPEWKRNILWKQSL